MIIIVMIICYNIVVQYNLERYVDDYSRRGKAGQLRHRSPRIQVEIIHDDDSMKLR